MRKFARKHKNTIEHFILFGRKKLVSLFSIISRTSRILGALLGFAMIFVFIYEVGFEYTNEIKLTIKHIYSSLLELFILIASIDIISGYAIKREREIKIPYIVCYSMLFGALIPVLWKDGGSSSFWFVWDILSSNYYIIFVLLLFSFLHISSALTSLLGKKTNPSLIIVVSFFVIIFIGTGLLLLPKSSVEGISFIDALFISTSSVCVTGLSPVDISEVFTRMGQVIILILIQVGGIGVMTLTSFFALFFIGNATIYNQIVVSDMISSSSINNLLSTLFHIIGLTVIIELSGFVIVWYNIHGTMGYNIEEEMWFSLFHSVSAFCNAGFSTLPANLANPILTGNNPFFIVISWLIILGGLGFPILSNVLVTIKYKLSYLYYRIIGQSRTHRYKYIFNINAKLVLTTTFILLIVSSVMIAFFEWNGAFKDMTIYEKIVQSFFCAVTPRTAGFNSIDMGLFSVQTTLLTIFLMWIGGGAQSTAGGIKVNAFAVAILSTLAYVRGKSKVDALGREITSDSIWRSMSTIFISIFVLGVSILLMTIIEKDMDLVHLAYECFSALGTTGLSLGITSQLSEAGKIVIIILMYVGRIGLITLLLGVVKRAPIKHFNYPSDNIIIT